MRKTKKILALLTALSISASTFAGLATTAFADEVTGGGPDVVATTAPELEATEAPAESWSVQYLAEAAVHSNPNIALSARDVQIGGQTYTVNYLGSVSGGIEEATPGVYNDQPGGTATFTVNAETAGDYNITVTCMGDMARRIDMQIGETVYPFPTEVSEEYSALWTKISEGSRDVFTYTFEDIALAEGENAIIFGTKIKELWAPDLIGIDVVSAGPEIIPVGISYKNGEVRVNVADVAEATLLYAQYNSNTGALKSVETYPLTFTEGLATVELADAVNGAKLMVWDSVNGMKPISDAVTVTGGIEATPDPTPEPTPTPTPDPNATVEPTPTPIPTPTPEPTPTPTPRPTVDPELLYYSMNYEEETPGAAIGTTNTAVSGDKQEGTITLADGTLWESKYGAGFMSIAEDKTKADIGKHFTYLIGSSSGGRGAVWNMGESAKQLDDQNRTVFEMDFSMSGGAGGQLVLGDTYTPSKTNTEITGDYVIALYYKEANKIAVGTLNGATETPATTGYTAGAWAHLKGVLDFTEKTVVVTITSLDGATTYLEETKMPMGGTSHATVSHIGVYEPRNSAGKIGIDNVMFRQFVDGDITGVYYMATFDVDGTPTTKTADITTGLIDGVPETVKTGYLFKGWYKDDDTTTLISTEEVLSTKLTTDVKYTAHFEKDPDYVEPMVAVEFETFPEGGLPVAGADENTAASNPIKVRLIGEIGTDLLANPDDRVTDLDIKWEFDGFRTVVSKNEPTTDAADSNEYCDSYAQVVYGENPAEVDFQLKNVAFNFYGQVKATVTYNGNTITIAKPMSILPDAAPVQGQILPKAGYVSDFDLLEDSMVGYKATISGDNKAATDIVTGDWAAYGGNNGRGLYIAEEGGKKFLQLNSTGTNSSSFAVNKLDNAPTEQVIISQDIRFHNANSSILFKSLNPVTWNAGATTFSLNFTGTEFNLNGGAKIADATTGVWYKIVLSADVTSKLCYAKIYSAEGELLGESEVMPFSEADSVTPLYLCYRTPDNSQGKLDFNNVRMYTPEIAGELTTTIENETLSVPEEGDDAATTTLTVTASSTEGYDMIGAADWTIVDEPENVTITPAADNSHTATLSVANGAQPGEITVRVTLGGKTKDIPVTLSSSQDSVSFTQQTRSISIPMDAAASADYTYAAQVVDKDGNEIVGKTVTYAMYDKNNVNELTEAPAGISFNKETGVLTVTGEAKATTVHIRATGTNSDDETISRAVKVTIHGLAFDFGTDADGAVVEGYTAVAPGTAYSETAGYGIEGTATAGGSADAENADSDNLAGNFTFKVKVQPAKVYDVTINYAGNVASEYVNSDLTGVALSNATQSTASYVIPVIDDVLDLSFTGGTVSSIVIEKQADKQPGGKPNVFTVGDSTSANNGSWAYVFARDYATKAPEFAEIATLSNNGRGSKNLGSYYTGGELRDRVLSQIKPGDYVMIGCMGTNGMGNDFETAYNWYIDACEAMGAKVIPYSYSPHGPVGGYGGYDAATQTFETYRKDSYDNIVRAIYAERSNPESEKYDANVVGFVDIGKMADAAFNAYVDNYEANGHTSRDAAAQAIIACFGDHNHYGNDGRSQLVAEFINWGYEGVDAAKGVAATLVEILEADLAE